ncbi:hypothetical protein LJC59_06535 [Desulfovibrio sp. OttesenSCG-928-A18]|nr:hypothetical protein [Desulfovibrio sp. OttesenSCG-928-A18]
MSTLVPFVFWCATAIFLICAYPISPPGSVAGLSSTSLANGLFLVSTCCLVIGTYVKGGSRRGTPRKMRFQRRVAYIWLCVVILAACAALNDLVRRGTINMPLFVLYAVILVVMLGVFFILRYWKWNSDKDK